MSGRTSEHVAVSNAHFQTHSPSLASVKEFARKAVCVARTVSAAALDGSHARC